MKSLWKNEGRGGGKEKTGFYHLRNPELWEWRLAVGLAPQVIGYVLEAENLVVKVVKLLKVCPQMECYSFEYLTSDGSPTVVSHLNHLESFKRY